MPWCLEAVEGAGAASLSSSSSASLSDPEDEDDEEEEEAEEDEDEDEDEDEELFADFLDWDLGASFISTSDSLELAEALVVFFFPAWFSQFRKISSNEGTPFASLDDLSDLADCSFVKAELVFVKPNSVKKAPIEAIS